MTTGQYSTSETADRLGVSTAYLRSQAKAGRWGAAKPVGERSWFFAAGEIDAEVVRRNEVHSHPHNQSRNAAQPAIRIDPVLDTADAGTWELERQLLIAQAAAESARADRAELSAAIEIRDQQLLARDQTIATLQSELGRTRTELTRMAAFVQSAAASHLD